MLMCNGAPATPSLSEVLFSLGSRSTNGIEVLSPLLIPGTEVSEKLNKLHGFMLENNLNVKVDGFEEQDSPSSPKLKFEPHPEEYLELKIREKSKALQLKKDKVPEIMAFDLKQNKIKPLSNLNDLKVSSHSSLGTYSISW